MKKLIPVVIAIILILIIGAATAGSIVFDKYSYSKEQADLQEYFGVSGDELAIFLQDEKVSEKALLKGGLCYFDLDTIHKYFNDFVIRITHIGGPNRYGNCCSDGERRLP